MKAQELFYCEGSQAEKAEEGRTEAGLKLRSTDYPKGTELF